MVALVPVVAVGQGPPRDRWAFHTRVALSGSSDHSDPSGFTVYSGIALEVALSRRLGSAWGIELGLRNESREVDRERSAGPAERLGSLELLPVTLLLQRRFDRGRGLRPYLGLGGNLTVAWEKSGVLDSLDVKPHVGPAVQAGVDLGLAPAVMFNVEARWQTLAVQIDGTAARFTRLRIHPLTLGAGLGFRF